MGVPASKEARLFYRCAFQRFEEAKILQKSDRGTGAVYLAGYGVECILKALVLNQLTKIQREEMLKSFRGMKAHNFVWLRNHYLNYRGLRFPPNITQSFTLVSDWSTEWRYLPHQLDPEETEIFMKATEDIIHWAKERM